MRKLLILNILLSLLCLLGISFCYTSWKGKNANLDRFLPNKTVCIYQSNDLYQKYISEYQKKFSNFFTHIPAFQRLQDLMQGSHAIFAKQSLENLPTYLVFYLNQSHCLTPLIYYDFPNTNIQHTFRMLLEHILSKQYFIEEVAYKKYSIQIIRDEQKKILLACCFYKNYLVLSSSVSDLKHLIDQTVGYQPTLKIPNFVFKPVSPHSAKLYLDPALFQKVLSSFLQTPFDYLDLSAVKHPIHFNIHFTTEGYFLSGFMAAQNNVTFSPNPKTLSIFYPLYQRPRSSLLEYLPQAISKLEHYTYPSSIDKLYEWISRQEKKDQISSIWKNSKKIQEMAFVQLANLNEMLIIRKKNLGEVMQEFQNQNYITLQEEMAGIKLYTVDDLGQDPMIRYFFRKELPRYVMSIQDNILIVVTHATDLRGYIENVDRERNWLAYQESIQFGHILHQAPFKMFWDVRNYIKALYQECKPLWRGVLEKLVLEKVFDQFSIQVNYPRKDSTFIQMYLKDTQPKKKEDQLLDEDKKGKRWVAEEDQQQEIKKAYEKKLDVSFIQKVYLPLTVNAQNVFENYAIECIVQDQKCQVYGLNKKGEVVWKKSLAEPIVSKVFGIDFYKNGKIQYLFATKKNVYLIDRKGNMVEGYPFQMLKTEAINQLNLIDYEGNKNYRFCITGESGKMYLYDKYGGRLLEWPDKSSEKKIIETLPYHVQVESKDYFILLSQNGELHALNRRGNEYNGFPIQMDQKGLYTTCYLKKAEKIITTLLHVWNQEGFIEIYDLNGVYKKQINLAAQYPDFHFNFCLDELRKRSYVVLGQNEEKLCMLNEEGELLLEIPKPQQETNSWEGKYYDLKDNRKLYVLWNKKTKKASLYTEKRVLYKLISAEDDLEISYDAAHHDLNIYTFLEGNYKKYTLKVK